MNLPKLLKTALALLLATSFAACGEKTAGKRNDTVLEAYRLIDEHRTDEAIELLETSLSEEPKNMEFKRVLASAYAHKAGIRIQALVPAMSQASKLKHTDSKPYDFGVKVGVSSSMNDGALKIADLLTQFAGALQAYAAIPLVDKNQAVYLNHAIYLLNEVGSETKPEDALYRAVLEVVLFKHIMADELIGEFIRPKEANEQNCRLNLGSVNNSIITLGKLLIDIYGDLGIANPKQVPDAKAMAARTANDVSNLTIATTSVTVLDEAGSLFLKQTAIQNGFGKIIKCGGS